MTEKRLKLAQLGCLLTMLLAILDQNIVSSAAVRIVRDLDPVHGLARLPWLVTAYALAATAALPLYGKLCDVYGPKRIYLGAIGVFLTGSALCGLAGNMTELIAFRAVQGLGGGGLMSVTLVVIAHLVPPQRQARQGGLAGLMAGVGMVAGPAVGGLLADHASWRWIFYVNLPLGLAAFGIAATLLHLPDRTRRHRIDYLGALLVAGTAVVVLLTTEWGGKRYAWGSPTILVLLALGAALLAGFLWRQYAAAEPILPLMLLRNATLRTAIPIQTLLGVMMVGSIVYVMVYLQVVQHRSPSSAGLYLIPTAVGMTGVGMLASRLMDRGWPVKWFVLSGTACATVGELLLSRLRSTSPSWWIWLCLFVVGLGIGQLIGQLIVVCQQAVRPHEIGVTTTAIRFGQSLGGAIGAAALGVLLDRSYTARTPGGVPLDAASPAQLPAALDAYTWALDRVFLAGAAVMAVAFVLSLALRVPSTDPSSSTQASAPEQVASAPEQVASTVGQAGE